MVMELLYLPRMDIPQENSNMILNVDKSVSIYPFQFHYLCSHSLVQSNLSGEHLTSMEKELFSSILNGRPSPADGRKNPRKPKSSKPISQLITKIEKHE
jgi:hypothetical protein